MRRRVAAFGAFGLLTSAALGGQQQFAPPPQTPVFRTGVNLVLVDVVVRDKTGAVVKGLTANDFELLEDGKRQQILTFAFEDITNDAAPIEGASALPRAAAKPSVPSVIAGAPAVADGTPSAPLTSEDVAGHRLLTL